MLKMQRNAIIVDTKRTEDWTDVSPDILGERDIFRVRGGRFIYHVDGSFLTDDKKPEQFFRWALASGGRVIYCDELLDIIPVPGLKILATQGRAAGVGLWVATQRPANIPLYTISETQHSFIFYHKLKADKERIEESVAASTGAPIPWNKLLKTKHSFVHINDSGEVSRPAKLELK
jgi:hypothetical protein